MFDKSERLVGRVGVVTGGSSGIGLALATALSEAGAQVAVCSRHMKSDERVGYLARSVDVGNREEVRAFVKEAADIFGKIDIAIANAGVGSYGAFLDTPARHIDEMVATNVIGTINLYQAAIPYIRAAGGGDLVTVASEAGRRGLPGEAVYSATKFAQVGLTRALDNELRDDGIRCTNICPGGVATNFAIGDERGRSSNSPALLKMMKSDDVVEVVMFALTRPRHMRLLEVALRPMSEASWG